MARDEAVRRGFGIRRGGPALEELEDAGLVERVAQPNSPVLVWQVRLAREAV
jgi:hypothetical protein